MHTHLHINIQYGVAFKTYNNTIHVQLKGYPETKKNTEIFLSSQLIMLLSSFKRNVSILVFESMIIGIWKCRWYPFNAWAWEWILILINRRHKIVVQISKWIHIADQLSLLLHLCSMDKVYYRQSLGFSFILLIYHWYSNWITIILIKLTTDINART